MERLPLPATCWACLIYSVAMTLSATPIDQASPTSGTTPTSVPPPHASPEIQRLLDAMDHASTDGHPNLAGEFTGMRRLFKGDYAGALKYFKIGARYADKPSQASIGTMYLNGRGVAKDPATACAWLTLAAERGRPKNYLHIRDAVCGTLPSKQHERAMTALENLRPEYGDAVAKPRMKLALLSARASTTGSHVGYDFNITTVAATDLDAMDVKANCTGPSLFLGGVQIPRKGCGIYDPKLLDPKKYFAARDLLPQGTVTIGELRKVDTPPPDAAPKPDK